MTTLSLTLVVLAAILHASWNLASKRAADAGSTFVFFYRLCSAIVCLPWVIYVLMTQETVWTGTAVLFLLLSTVLHLAYSLSLMGGYRVADLSIVYPVARGTGPLLASVAAIVWLSEPLSAAKAAGIAGVVFGILFIATQGQWQRFLRTDSWIGIRWGIVIGLFIASYSLVDAYSVKSLFIAPVVLDGASSLGGALLLAPRVWADRAHVSSRMAGKWRLTAFVGVASPLAYILVLYALQFGAQVSQVAPLREMSMIVATVVGAVLLREKVGLSRWLGCCVILVGVVLISTS